MACQMNGNHFLMVGNKSELRLHERPIAAPALNEGQRRPVLPAGLVAKFDAVGRHGSARCKKYTRSAESVATADTGPILSDSGSRGQSAIGLKAGMPEFAASSAIATEIVKATARLIAIHAISVLTCIGIVTS